MAETVTARRVARPTAPARTPLSCTPAPSGSRSTTVLRAEMARGGLQPGAFLDLNELASRLGVSRTPLREALLHLESQGFVTVLPRRGFRLNALTLDDIRHFYEIIGALEAAALRSVGPSLGPADFARMRALDAAMAEAVAARDFDRYYEANLAFHDVYLRPQRQRAPRLAGPPPEAAPLRLAPPRDDGAGLGAAFGRRARGLPRACSSRARSTTPPRTCSTCTGPSRSRSPSSRRTTSPAGPRRPDAHRPRLQRAALLGPRRPGRAHHGLHEGLPALLRLVPQPGEPVALARVRPPAPPLHELRALHRGRTRQPRRHRSQRGRRGGLPHRRAAGRGRARGAGGAGGVAAARPDLLR